MFSKNVIGFGNVQKGEAKPEAAKVETIKLMLHQIRILNYADQKEVLALLQTLVFHQSSL